MNRVYSKELIQSWKQALIDTYGFEEYMDFLIQPTFTNTYLTYLPHINYTDRERDNIADLLELAKESNYQIRILNFAYKDFKEFDTVTLRLNVKGCKNAQDLKKMYKKLAKRSINRDKRKYHLTIKRNNDIELFYAIISSIYKDHGTPIFPKELLVNLKKYMEHNLNFHIFYDKKEPIGGFMSFFDNKILTFQMGGLLKQYKKIYSGYYLQHLLIIENMENFDIEVVDFGRSPYNGGTYFFKTRFGAKPVKIDILTNRTKNIYQTYSFASAIWKRLPKSLANTIGPKITKYLVDL